MRSRQLAGLALVVAALGVGESAQAQAIRSPYRFLDHTQGLGAYAGYVSTSEGVLANGPQAGPQFGVRWSYRVSGPMSLGVEVGYLPTMRTVRDTSFVTAESMYRAVGEADVKLLSALANLRIDITGARTWNGLQPWVLLGGGAAIDLAGSAEVESDLPAGSRYDFGTSFAAQLGGGIDWYPSERFSVGLGARNLLWKLEVPELFGLTENGARLVGSRWEQNWILSAGLSIHF